MAFGTEVRRIRQLRGLSIEDLAENSGLSANYVGGIEMNQRDPSLSTVTALAKGLRISISELFQDTPDSLTPIGRQMALAIERLKPSVQEAIVRLASSLAREAKLPTRKATPKRGAKRPAARRK
jgi:transcriptional regulator with XRE-family HTH domain